MKTWVALCVLYLVIIHTFSDWEIAKNFNNGSKLNSQNITVVSIKIQDSVIHEYSMKHHSGGFSSERWRSVGGDFQTRGSQSGQRCLHAHAQPLSPPAASVETPHGFDRPPLHTRLGRLGKGTRRRVGSSLSRVLSKARAIKFWPTRRRRNQNRKLHKFGKELENTVQNWSSFPSFLKESTHAMQAMDVFPSGCGKFCLTVFSCSLPRTYVKRGWHHLEARDLSVPRGQHPLAGVLD